MDAGRMTYTIECEQDATGRWLAEVLELPGVLVYGESAEEVVNKVQAQALRAVATLIEHCPNAPVLVNVSFAFA
ncbi:MAG TPA: hypothetical protein VNA19_07915 [Pyrinomonadaceae bacterium]|jgi:predicted RNase H-like HicB family nuclease|nr:hypothetical protein [Pyrinomonadaceae bacterium]